MNGKVSEIERRLVLRVLNRWEERRGARAFLPQREADPSLFGEDWPSCLLLDLARPGDPGFRYIGAALRRGHGGADWHSVSQCPEGTLLRHMTEFYPQVLDRRIPVSVGGAGRHQERDILFRAILLPLSEDGGRIDFLLGAANCRAVASGG
jgi:hypothetical protein